MTRRFAFDLGTSRADALAIVRAALDDEALEINPAGQHPAARINTVVVDGQMVVVVPDFRIAEKETR